MLFTSGGSILRRYRRHQRRHRDRQRRHRRHRRRQSTSAVKWRGVMLKGEWQGGCGEGQSPLTEEFVINGNSFAPDCTTKRMTEREREKRKE